MITDEAVVPLAQVGPSMPHTDERFALVERFLSHEARLLNNNALVSWLELLDPEIRYVIPIRTTRLPADGPGFEVTYHVDDDFGAIHGKVRRAVETGSAWAEMPQSRTRRFVTNLQLFESGTPNIVHAVSSLLVFRGRGDNAINDLLSAERQDAISIHDPSNPRLLTRQVFLDHTILPSPNLGIFL